MAKKIQETGPLTYRQLQKMNADPNSIASAEDIQKAGGVNWGREAARRNKLIDAQVNDVPVQSPVFTNSGGIDYYGRSMFDPDVIIGQTIADQGDTTITDTRAENQPWYAKLGAGIGKGIVLAGTTFLDGTIGLLSGLGTAVSEHRWSGLFDNTISNGLNEVNRQIENILPNYRTQEEQERPWYENLGTVNFWADSFLKNLGFTVGAVYSGSAFTKALGAMKWIKSGVGAALTGSIYSAINEGRIEANNTQHDLLELHTQQLRDAYNKRYSEIVNSNMSDIDKQNALTELDANFDKEDAKNIDNARLAGDIDLLGNVILLSLDNFNTYGRLFSRGFKNAERTAQNSIRTAARHADEKISSRIIRAADGSYEFGKYGARDIAKSGLKTAALEGNEEMAQQFLSNFSGNVRSYDSPDAYYKALLDSKAEQNTMDTTKALAQAFTDSYGDGQQWEQFAVGALTGILGAPTFGRVNNSNSDTYLGRGKVIGLTGGIFGEMGQNREANQRGQEIANRMNSFAQKLQDHQRYFTQSQSFTDAMDGFAKDNNAFEFKNAEDNEAFSAMSAFAQAGRLDDYRQMVDADFDNMSDEDLDTIAKTTSQNTDDDSSAKDQGWRNADGTYMSETEEGRQKMRQELSKKRDKILSQIDAYTESLDKVRGIGNNSLTDDQVNELAWLDWKVGQFSNRLKEVNDKAKPTFTSIKKGIDQMIEDLENERFNLTEQDKDNDGNSVLEENTKQLKIYRNLSKVFDGLINGNTNVMASLSNEDNKEAVDYLKSKGFFTMFSSHNNSLSYLDYKDAMNSLNDIPKLANIINTFNSRLEEFTKDPLKLIQNRQKIDKEKAKSEKTKSAIKTKDKIDNASVSDIVSQMESGDITDDSLDSILDSIDETLENEDDSDNSTKEKINTARDIIDSSHRAEDKLDNLVDDPDVEGQAEEVLQAVQDAKSLLAASKSKANSKDELFDTESEAWNDPNNLLTDEVQQAMAELTPEEQQAMLQGRIDRAKNAMEKVKSFIYDEDKESSKMPNSKEQAKNSEAAAKKEKKERANSKDNNGIVASSDSETPDASAHQINLNDNQPSTPTTTVNQDARDLLKDVVLPDDIAEDTYNAVDNVLKSVDFAWKRGLRGTALHDAITNTESWKKATQAITDSDLGDRINNYISNKYKEKPKAKAKAKTNKSEEPFEVRTPSPDIDRNTNEIKGQWEANPERPTYDYWKPTTTEIGIHDNSNDARPFFETAKVINSIFDKLSKNEALDPYEQLVYDEYIKPGYITKKYTDAQLKSMEAVYNYLKDKDAFNQVNNGSVKVGTKIHFTVDNRLNEQAGEPIVLMTLDDGTVVGDLSANDIASQAFVNSIIEEYKKSDKDYYTSDTTTTVRQLMRGKAHYSADANNVNAVFEGNGFKLGISMGRGENAPIVAEAGRKKAQGRSAFERTIVPPLNAVEGQPYILLPTAGKTQQMCVPFTMKKFTKETADSTIGKAIKSVINKIPTSATNPMSIKTSLEELLSAEFHINYNGDNVVITIKTPDVNHQKTIYNGKINNPNITQVIEEALYETPYQVSRKYINDKYTFDGEEHDYNTMIGEVSDVNLPLGTTSTINDWFTLNPINSKAHRVKSTRKNPTARTAKSVVSVSIDGFSDIKVNTSSWRVESSDKALTPEQEDIAKAIAYGISNEAVDTTKPYDTRWGRFDPNTNTFIKSEYKGGITLRSFNLSPEEKEENDDNSDKPSNNEQEKEVIDRSRFTTPISPLNNESNLAGSHNLEGASLLADNEGNFIPHKTDISNLKVMPALNEFFVFKNNEATLKEATGFEILSSGKFEDVKSDDGKTTFKRVTKKGVIKLLGKGTPITHIHSRVAKSEEAKLADKIQRESQKVQLTTDKKYYVDGKGTKYARVTSIIQADKDGEVFDENSPWVIPSTNIGTGLDEMGRDFMAGRIVFNPTTNAYEVSGVPIEYIYPNIDRAHATSYINQWADLKRKLDGKGIHIVPREVVAKGQLNIKDKQGKDHTINVAGTLDLLGYDDSGNWYIFDMKTHHSNTIDAEKKAKWARQLALYKKFLENEYGINVTITAIIPTKVNYPAPTTATNIYSVDSNKPRLYNGVESNQLTLNGKPFMDSNPVMGSIIGPNELGTDKVSLDIQLDKLSPTEKDILSDYNSTKVTYEPKGHEIKGDLDANAKEKGLIATKKKQTVWNALSDEQKKAILDNGHAKQIMNKLEGAYSIINHKFNEKRLGADIDTFLGVGKNRLATTEKYTPWKPEKELGWLRKTLPQFSDDEHLSITKSLIKLDGRRKAFGRFKQGVIYIADTTARGTVYHEAFHAVFNTLLDNNEQTDVMNAARAKYGDLSSIQLEENLAEDFRRYIQWEQTPVLGTLVKAFRKIKHIVFGLLHKNSILDKLYYNISRGRFANKVAGTTNADRPRLYASDINDAINKLDSDYRRGKQLEGTISSNMQSVVDKFIKDNDLQDVAYSVKYNNSDKWVMRVTKKNYNEKRNFLMNRLISTYNSELSSDERNSEKALLEQEEREDEQFNRAIEQWHIDKLMYSNLAEDDKLYLQERGISIDEYNEMSPFEKEVLFRCKY